MAMINDKGPEESRDTDATYIILSHQSVHLPGPSWQRGGGVGSGEWGGSWGAGGEGRQRVRKRERGSERTRAIYFQYFAQRNRFSPLGRAEKRKTSDKEVIG